MYYLSVSGSWGNCMVSWENSATVNFDSAMTFEKKKDAEEWISEHGSEWLGVKHGLDKMTICEVK